MSCLRLGAFVLAWTASAPACSGGGGGEDAGIACPTHADPSFELGTGATAFEPIAEGQKIALAPGPQGGCHIWVAVVTDGFADRRFEIAYALFFADTGEATGSTSRQKVRLLPLPEDPARCTFAGYTAFALMPAELVGKRLRLEVTVTDDLGRSASASRTVVPDWPPGGPAACNAGRGLDAGPVD